MNPCRPAALRLRDKVCVVAPAGPIINSRDFKTALAFIKERYRVEWRDELLTPKGFFAGDDKRRSYELQAALDDPAISAVFAARGGWGTSRIIDQLNTAQLMNRPRWIIGSSDLTVLLIKLWIDCKMMSIHGPMPAGFSQMQASDRNALFRLLEGEPWHAPKELIPMVKGSAEGPLLGGNLTMLAHLAGCVPASFTDGAILFLEDVAEMPYRVDRNFVQLKRSGILNNVAGIVLGNFTNCTPGADGLTVEQVIQEQLLDLGVPVARNYPAAHGDRNYPFIHGCRMQLVVSNDFVKFKETIISC